MFGGLIPQNGPINPFSYNTMTFKLDAIHEASNTKREGCIISITAPINATELQARKLILEMAYQHGWQIRMINRTDNKEEYAIE